MEIIVRHHSDASNPLVRIKCADIYKVYSFCLIINLQQALGIAATDTWSTGIATACANIHDNMEPFLSSCQELEELTSGSFDHVASNQLYFQTYVKDVWVKIVDELGLPHDGDYGFTADAVQCFGKCIATDGISFGRERHPNPSAHVYAVHHFMGNKSLPTTGPTRSIFSAFNSATYGVPKEEWNSIILGDPIKYAPYNDMKHLLGVKWSESDTLNFKIKALKVYYKLDLESLMSQTNFCAGIDIISTLYGTGGSLEMKKEAYRQAMKDLFLFYVRLRLHAEAIADDVIRKKGKEYASLRKGGVVPYLKKTVYTTILVLLEAKLLGKDLPDDSEIDTWVNAPSDPIVIPSTTLRAEDVGNSLNTELAKQDPEIFTSDLKLILDSDLHDKSDHFSNVFAKIAPVVEVEEDMKPRYEKMRKDLQEIWLKLPKNMYFSDDEKRLSEIEGLALTSWKFSKIIENIKKYGNGVR